MKRIHWALSFVTLAFSLSLASCTCNDPKEDIDRASGVCGEAEKAGAADCEASKGKLADGMSKLDAARAAAEEGDNDKAASLAAEGNALCMEAKTVAMGPDCSATTGGTGDDGTDTSNIEAEFKDLTPTEVAAKLKVIYFDYDKFAIRADQAKRVNYNAEALKFRSDVGVTITGHCDERGTDEYNMALGSRRANAVKKALVDKGVKSKQLGTLSKGESDPAVDGHDEEAWAKNRRAEYGVK